MGCKTVEKWVHVIVESAEVGPVSPIADPNFAGLIQDPIGDVSPRSSVNTFEEIFVCSWSSSHEVPRVRGKSELNLVRKSVSDSS